MKILLTGGTGYIGSHTAVELLQHGHDIIIADNLSNSSRATVDRIQAITGKGFPFYQVDMTQEEAAEEIFRGHAIDGIIHLAGYKAVAESIALPLEYYSNNLGSTMTAAKLCLKYGVQRFVFSSSATVYGDQPSPVNEEMALLPTLNPYGETKAMSERILRDTAVAHPDLSVMLLRYFNPVGAHPSGLIGESPRGIPNNLMPYLTKVAKGELEKLYIFGNDYDTVDGTGVRDYIHVVDLARGHVRAIESKMKGTSVFNLGTNQGTSVLQLIEKFKAVNGIDIPYEIVGRRSGDLAEVYADAGKALRQLGWRAELGLADMVRDSWNFEKNHSLTLDTPAEP